MSACSVCKATQWSLFVFKHYSQLKWPSSRDDAYTCITENSTKVYVHGNCKTTVLFKLIHKQAKQYKCIRYIRIATKCNAKRVLGDKRTFKSLAKFSYGSVCRWCGITQIFLLSKPSIHQSSETWRQQSWTEAASATLTLTLCFDFYTRLLRLGVKSPRPEKRHWTNVYFQLENLAESTMASSNIVISSTVDNRK